MALGAFPFDETVRQKHVFGRIKKLLNRFARNQRAAIALGDVAKVAVNLAGEFVVLRRVGAVPVVKTDVKAIQIRLAPGGDISHKLLRCFARLLGGNHDRCAVGVVGADKVHLVALHPLKAHPDIGLDVLHDVTDVEIAVGVRERGGDEKLAHRHGKKTLRRPGWRARERF